MYHWIGVRMTSKQAMAFEKFKRVNFRLVKDWRDSQPQICELYPIYWSGDRWVWKQIGLDRIALYLSMCQATYYARSTESRTLPHKSDPIYPIALYMGRKRTDGV